MKAIRFTVRGIGQFPIDMLRYDRCWPFASFDAQAIEKSFQQNNLDNIEIDLVSINSPTVRRWESFLWRVVI